MSQAVKIILPEPPVGADSWDVYATQVLYDYSIFANLSDKTITASHEGGYFDISHLED